MRAPEPVAATGMPLAQESAATGRPPARSAPLPLVHPSIVAMLEHTCVDFPDQAALVMGNERLNYRQLRCATITLARDLRGAGVQGARVATVLSNTMLAAVLPYAIAASGAQHVPLNPLYTARELRYMLHDSQPRLLIVSDAMMVRLRELAQALPGCTMIAASQVAQRLHGPMPSDLAQDLLDWMPDPDAMAILQYTGGSSGFPKGVNLSHRAISTNVSQREGLLPVPRGTERVVCVMPLFHSYAMAMGLFLCGYSGNTLVILSHYQPQLLLDAIGKDGITIFPGSPTIFTGLLAHAAFAATDWSRVHTCYSGSAALPAHTLQAWRSATGAPIFEGYGQTEAGPVLTFNPACGPVKAGSVGIAVAATEVQVVDIETGTTPVRVGERGEIRARGPQVMAGYLNRPDDTAESLRDGWLYTGDIGEFDDDGYLYIRDRKKDLVIVGGFNVYPREIEEVLFTHPDVVDAAVVGQPDAYRGEILRAFVVLRAGAMLDAAAMLDFCRENLARYKLPARIEQLEALPKTTVNKTDKKVLKARVQAEAAPAAGQQRG